MWYQDPKIQMKKISYLEKSHRDKKRRQAGVEFPSARKQEHLLIIRFDISDDVRKAGNTEEVRNGLKRFCRMLDYMDNGIIKIERLLLNGDMKLVNLSDFNFSATLGFGKGFFEKMGISLKNYPKKIKEMPMHSELYDPIPYKLFQTDFIIQLGSNHEDVNRWVFQHFTASQIDRKKIQKSGFNAYHNQKKSEDVLETPTEIYSALSGWADIVDMHAGFQRIDGRNLLGFNDGISNPKRLSNDVVWTTIQDESQKYVDGTYMVFQKIEHDLEKWRNMEVDEQEKMIGRSKGTGLLLGTLSKEEDRKLGSELLSENTVIRNKALSKWKKLYEEQRDPDQKFFDPKQQKYRNIQLECPIWSHVRKSNPRQSLGAARSLIYRRGYLYIEGGGTGIFSSGLLFICFQKDIEKGFEYIKKQFLGNKDFPPGNHEKDALYKEPKIAPAYSTFNMANNLNDTSIYQDEQTAIETPRPKEILHNLDDFKPSTQYLGNPGGQILSTQTLGGGYYFIPPIPNKRISDLTEQFFS
jgi:Dyp-type peroxidase family